jgi:hypothetical protein
MGCWVVESIDLTNPEHRDRILTAGLKAWNQIGWRWQLTDEERPRLVPSINVGDSLDDQRTQDWATKVGIMIGIFRRLKILYSDRFAYAWIKLPNTNPLLGGMRPMDFMIEGGLPAMAKVALLLEGRIGIDSRL